MTALGALLLLAITAAACGDDTTSTSSGAGGSGGGTGGGATTTTATGTGGSGTGGGATTTTTATGTGGSGGGGNLQGCLDMVMPPGDACGTCACNNCLAELEACQMDMGCVAIRECAQMNMCTGIGCLGPCGMIIDMYGGVAGMSAGLGLTLSDCVDMNCMMECAP